MGFYSYLTGERSSYFRIDSEDTEEIDRRKTTLTPGRTDKVRIRRYYNNKIKNILDKRVA